MLPLEPLALHHSWPIVERDRRFAEGIVHEAPQGHFVSRDATADHVPLIGSWRCRLADSALEWSDPIYAIFGLPPGPVSREAALSRYRDTSRDAVERLRAHAIRHHRGFTLDTRIATVEGEPRWMRLIAAPVIEDNVVTTLHGLKQDVTHLYR